MKRLFIAASLFFLLSGIAIADLNDGLVVYYPFNGNANDESGNVLRLDLTGTASLKITDTSKCRQERGLRLAA